MIKWLRTSSIAKRLTIFFALVNGLTLFLTAIGFTIIVAYFSLRSFKQELTSIAELIATSSRAPLAFIDAKAGARVLSSLEANRNIKYGRIVDQQGQTLASYGDPNFGSTDARFLIGDSISWSFGSGSVIVTAPVMLDGDRVGTVVLSAGLDSFLSQLTGIAIICSLIIVLVALVSTLLALKLRGWVSMPIESLRKIANRVSETKDFSIRLNETKRDNEISDMIHSFNFMLENIEERDRSLRQSKERAEQADRAKSVFLASMSHELRTPLHAIISITDEVLGTKVDAEQKDLLLTIRNAGDSLLSIINDILDFSKIEAGKMELLPKAFELRSFLDKTIQMFHVPFTTKGISLALKISPEVPNDVVADPGRLSQVLVNLLGNALKFTKSGGAVEVLLEQTAQQGRLKPMLEFTVKDTGIGIPDNKLEYIFEAFSQVTDAANAQQGTGLGLTITARLVKLMGGRIWVSSREGLGSEFHFLIEYEMAKSPSLDLPSPARLPTDSTGHQDRELDLRNRAGRAEDTQQFKEGAAGTPTILIVEDHPVNRKVAQRIVTRLGCRPLIAENGLECLEIFEREQIDLILMDVNMPKMDGIECTRQIRLREKNRQLRRTPIIILTASIAQEDTQLCYDAGIDDFLVKPFRSAELIEKIEPFLQAKSLIKPIDQMH